MRSLFKRYKLWVDKDMVKEGMEFYVEEPWGYGLGNFFAQPGKTFPITSIWCYLKDKVLYYPGNEVSRKTNWGGRE
jgi:hypothetical protein